MSDDIVQSVDESKPKSKRHGCFFRLLKWCSVACLVVTLYVFIDALPFGGVTISPETTRITAPLTPDGKAVDYRQFFLEQEPKNMSTDENGFRVIARELGPSLLNKDPDKGQADWIPFCKALALDPEQKPNPKMHFVDWYDNYYSFLKSK